MTTDGERERKVWIWKYTGYWLLRGAVMCIMMLSHTWAFEFRTHVNDKMSWMVMYTWVIQVFGWFSLDWIGPRLADADRNSKAEEHAK